MSATAPTVTRFAPSPTGDLHVGNARTALFNFLLARAARGRFLLRIEDTDLERSLDEYRERQLADLRWLGLEWDSGPDREDERGPYRQQLRTELYARFFAQLERDGQAYPCFCSSLELEIARRSQLAAGRPPRYSGACRELSPAQQAAKRAQGIAPTLRFRVPAGRRVEFVDFVHGLQSFLSDDIGDFIVRRADQAAAFTFSNAVDDACMGVTRVLRGDDHLTNTPRQLMLLEALELPAPEYGHVALLVGADGAPLSKRHGATSVGEYRERGYTAGALTNHLFRLGHSSSEHGFLSLGQMMEHFDARHLGRAPAHFEEQQLRVWQKEAVQRMSFDEACAWLAGVLPRDAPPDTLRAFLTAALPNILLPADAQLWVDVVFGPPPVLGADAAQVVREAGREFFAAAAYATATSGCDLPAIAAAVKTATGRKGAALYRPLRLALTGHEHGPELALLLKALSPEAVRERLARFA
jgi:nondiscriminating glutamyl-tRNA synthetase